MRWKLLKALLKQLRRMERGLVKEEEVVGREREKGVIYVPMKCGDSYKGY